MASHPTLREMVSQKYDIRLLRSVQNDNTKAVLLANTALDSMFNNILYNTIYNILLNILVFRYFLFLTTVIAQSGQVISQMPQATHLSLETTAGVP